MHPFSLLIKPAAADCNLRCCYCFYRDRRELDPPDSRHRMDEAVLERLIASFLATDQAVHTFGWQGGEPTLLGEAFFRRVTELQRALGRPGTLVANGLQTNGTLITDELAAHLGAYHFLVGVSVDGPAAVHDRGRCDAAGHGSHAATLAGIERLRRNRVDFNVLTLVSRYNVDRPVETYEYLLDLGVAYQQYIECVAFDGDGRRLPFAINGLEWGAFLCKLFDRWWRRDTRRVSVRLFDTIMAQLTDGVSNMCACGQDCRRYFVVEYNGDVYPCDFYVYPEWRLGNVRTDTWEALQRSERYILFGARKRQWNAACACCELRRFCNGDCPKNREGPVAREPRKLSHLCMGWRVFYRHALPRLRELAREIERERSGTRAADDGLAAGGGGSGGRPPIASACADTHADNRPGRNGVCPRGGGRKFRLLRACLALGRTGTPATLERPARLPADGDARVRAVSSVG